MRKLLAAAILAATTGAYAHADTLIHAGRLIDGEARQPMTEMTIRIADQSIAAVERGYAMPGDGDTVVDLRNHTVMPGLMDLHVHLTGEYSADSRLRGFITNEADYAYMAAKYARRTLDAGFTTVRNARE